MWPALGLVGYIVISIFRLEMTKTHALESAGSGTTTSLFLDDWTTLSNVIKYAGGVIAVSGAIIAWAYRTAAQRLGVVDLFACEIGTLCRVGAVVDLAHVMIETYEKKATQQIACERVRWEPGKYASDGAIESAFRLLGCGPDRPASPQGTPPKPAEVKRFASEEDYFPVFNGNSHDLEILEADVVVNITAFYTYMKAMRDSQRRLAQLSAPPCRAEEAQAWLETVLNSIYMVFLSFESAREAIDDLIEFQPLRAECNIAILLTEIVAYEFLLEKFGEKGVDDFRYKRLEMRRPEYKDLMQELGDRVKAGADWASGAARKQSGALSRWQKVRKAQIEEERKSWKRAQEAMGELSRRYNRAFAA